MLQLITLIKDGGWAIFPIIAASIVSVALILECSWTLRKARKRYEYQLLHPKAPPEGSGDLFSTIMVHRLAHPHAAVDELRAHAEVVFAGVERRISWLNVIAAIAPLLGLLGTVSGMIRIFHEVSVARPTNPLAQLSGGISEALIATGGGLVVAIIAALGHHALLNGLDGLSSAVSSYLGTERKPSAPKRAPAEEARVGS